MEEKEAASSQAGEKSDATQKPSLGRIVAWLLHLLRDRILPNLREFSNERQLLVWIVSLAIGIGAAYLAILFRKSIGFVQWLWLGVQNENVFATARELDWWIVMLAPAIGGLVVGLFLQYVMPGKRAHGVPDVIEARALLGCKISTKVGFGSALVAAVSLGSGASAGREGPVVHLGATLASALEDFFKLPHSARRTLLACGVGAAVSASFNAPIAGVLFAHEVILGHYAMRAFVPIVISSVAATAVARIHIGDFPAFFIPEYQITSYWEFPAFVLLGLTCAAVVIAFEFAIVAAERVSQFVRVPLWTRPVIGGLMVGIIAIWFPQVLGVGYDATDAALKNQLPVLLMLVLLVLKAVATAITLASKFGGGIFSPSLYLGAMAGGAFGIIATGVFPEAGASQGLYALLGMGGVAAAMLGAPISTTVIVFELTGGYAMTIALLLTVSISTGITQALHGQSFFHYLLSNRGVFLREGPHKAIVRSIKVATFMLPTIGSDEEAESFQTHQDSMSWVTEEDTIEAALRAFDRTGRNRLPVVDAMDTSKLIGWIERVDTLDTFNRALVAATEEEHK